MGGALRWVFLVVVGRQVIVVGADEDLEEAPGPSGHPAQEQLVGLGEHGPLVAGRSAQPPRQRWRERPGERQRCGQRQRARSHEPQRHDDGDRDARRAAHEAVGGEQAGARAALRVAGSAPLEQVAPTDVHAPAGAQYGADADEGVVGQACEGECLARELEREGIDDVAQVAMTRELARAARQGGGRGEQAGHDQDRQDHERRRSGQARDRPAAQQQGEQGDRYEAASQVVDDLPA